MEKSAVAVALGRHWEALRAGCLLLFVFYNGEIAVFVNLEGMRLPFYCEAFAFAQVNVIPGVVFGYALFHLDSCAFRAVGNTRCQRCVGCALLKDVANLAPVAG